MITVYHHSASSEKPNGDPQVGALFHLHHHTHDIVVVFSITFSEVSMRLRDFDNGCLLDHRGASYSCDSFNPCLHVPDNWIAFCERGVPTVCQRKYSVGWSAVYDCDISRPRCYKTWVQSQTQNKTQWWLLTCPQAANHCALFWVWEWTQVL